MRPASGAEVGRAGLIELDVPGAGLDPALPEPPGGAKRGHRGSARSREPAGSSMVTSTDPACRTGQGARARRRAAGPRHPRRRCALDPGLLGGPDVMVVAGVGRAEVDGRCRPAAPPRCGRRRRRGRARAGSARGSRMRAWRYLRGVSGASRRTGAAAWRRLASAPSRWALGAAGGAASGRPRRRVQGGRRGPDEPAVHREAGLLGGLLDPALQRLAQPEVDPGRRGVVAVGRGRRQPGRGIRAGLGGGLGHRRGDHEAGLAAAQPQVHRAGRELRVISSAASDRASSRASRAADSSVPVSRSASARASSPPASAATASSWRRLLTYGPSSMAP